MGCEVNLKTFKKFYGIRKSKDGRYFYHRTEAFIRKNIAIPFLDRLRFHEKAMKFIYTSDEPEVGEIRKAIESGEL